MNKRIRKKLYKKHRTQPDFDTESVCGFKSIRTIRSVVIKKWYHKRFTVRDNQLYRRYRIIIRGHHIPDRMIVSSKLKNKKYRNLYTVIKRSNCIGRIRCKSYMETLFITKEFPCDTKFMTFSKWGFNIKFMLTNPIAPKRKPFIF